MAQECKSQVQVTAHAQKWKINVLFTEVQCPQAGREL